ncbi:GNAT family N-acetyltransferase [Chloroflexota bacterium]
MDIREARADDNLELQELQATCPQGTTLVVSTVNTPDFFARVKVYEDFNVYVACENNRIIASAACAVRNAIVDGKVTKIGHGFQAFVDPEYRGRRIAGQLYQLREDYMQQHGAVLAYSLIMEGNTPSMRHVTRRGFKLHRTMVMPSVMVYKEMPVKSRAIVRAMTQEDLAVVVNLINETWHDYESHEQMTAESFVSLIARMPAYNYENVIVLEENNRIEACIGFWDWSQIMQITMKALSPKMKVMNLILDIARIFRPLPQGPKVGDVLKQAALTPIGFRNSDHLTILLKNINNQLLPLGIQQIFCLCEKEHPLLKSLKEFIHIDTAMHIYVKPLQDNVSLVNKPLFIDGLDL